MNPKAVPTSEARGGRSPVLERSTTSQSGTDAKISEASPIGTRALGDEQQRVAADQQQPAEHRRPGPRPAQPERRRAVAGQQPAASAPRRPS